ncbi:MAG: hypothetical protein SFV54_08355 [Bryobacteraceae bacterium]|nr:hypothetical protein [Bryobacteraceae bacterium]
MSRLLYSRRGCVLFLALLYPAGSLNAESRTASRPAPEVVEHYTNFLQALFGLRYSPSERAEIQRHVSGYWATGDREAIDTVNNSAATWRNVQQQDPELIAAAFSMTRADTLVSVQKAADQGREDSRYLLSLYYRANPILAPAKPGGLPLTRDMVEADLAVKHWLATEIQRQPVPRPDAAAINAAIQAATRVHSSLTADEQLKMGKIAGEWARIRYGWSRASAIDRLITIQDMGGRLTPREQAAVQQVIMGFNAQLNGMVSQHRDAMFSSAIQSMKQNSDTIMGRGTVWNPATNRWEQQGGIVTEYNGTVRVP